MSHAADSASEDVFSDPRYHLAAWTYRSAAGKDRHLRRAGKQVSGTPVSTTRPLYLYQHLLVGP